MLILKSRSGKINDYAKGEIGGGSENLTQKRNAVNFILTYLVTKRQRSVFFLSLGN